MNSMKDMAMMIAVGLMGVCAHAATNTAPTQRTATVKAPANRVAAPSLPKLSVDEIVERNVSARGGAAAWARVTSMTLSGKLDAGQERKDGGSIAALTKMSKIERKAYEQQIASGKAAAEQPKIIQLPYTLTLQRPNKSRLEIPFRGDTAVQIYDGAQGWKLRPFLGRHEVEAYTSEELKNAASEQQLDGPLVNYAAKGTKVALDGTDMVNGHGAYRLKLTLRSGAVRHVWIDAQSFLESRIEGTPRRFDGKVRPVMTDMRDYRPVQGLMVARELVTTVEGTRQSDRILVENVTINPALNGSPFAKPM